MALDPNIMLQGQNPDIVGQGLKSYAIGRQMAKDEAESQSSNALAQYMASKPKGKSLAKHLEEGGYPAQALEYAKQEADIGKANASAQETQGKISRQQMELAGSIAQDLMSEPSLTKEGILQKYDNYSQAGVITPEMYRPMAEEVSQLPDDPQALRQWVEGKHQMVMKAAELHGFLQPSANARLSAQTTMRGQDLGNQLGNDRLNVEAYGQASNRAETARYHDMQSQNFQDKLAQKNAPMKLPAAQQKQLTGVQNTQAAIQEYRDQLKGYSLSDLASPDARAIMDMKYNNMMLQAKEAYNLGVLNGPDYEILQRVVTSPNSLKGVITSNSALDQQAGELDRIMGNIGKVAEGNQQGGASEQQNAVDPDLQHTADKYGMTVEELQQFLGQ